MNPAAVELARFVAIRESVATVARILDAESIPVAPLKGALILGVFAGRPVARAIGDIDLLVPSARFDDAVRLLESRGARESGRNPDGRTKTFLIPGVRFEVDLHRRLFRRGLYRFDEAAMLARGRRDADAFGTEVVVLEAEDAFAHAIAHHAGGRPLASVDRLADDLGWLAPSVDLARLADRIRESGLVRALEFVALDLAANGRVDPTIDSLRAVLATDPIDSAVARVALALAREPRTRGLGSLARHLTNASAREALVSLVSHVATTGRDRLSRFRRPSPGRP